MTESRAPEFETLDEELAAAIPGLHDAIAEHSRFWAAEGIKAHHALFMVVFMPRLLELLQAGEATQLRAYFGFVDRMAASPEAMVRDIVSTVVMGGILGSSNPTQLALARRLMGPESADLFDATGNSRLFKRSGT